jgi:hypothetical protein
VVNLFLAYTEIVKAKVKLTGATRVKGGVLLKSPVRITEDEADAIISQRRLAEKKRIPLDEMMRSCLCG